MKVFNLIFCFLFVICAALQYNDPDPYIWMPIYLFGAFICWQASKGKFYSTLSLAGVLVYAVYAVYLFFTKDGVEDWVNQHQAEDIAATMKASTPWIEDTREFFGLCILIFVVLLNYFYAKRKGLFRKS